MNFLGIDVLAGPVTDGDELVWEGGRDEEGTGAGGGAVGTDDATLADANFDCRD